MEPLTDDRWRTHRDAKLWKMLDPDVPAWLVAEDLSAANDLAHFSVVHRWEPDGWARRRYRYDIVSDVIHFQGTTQLDDSDIVKMKPEQRISHRATPR